MLHHARTLSAAVMALLLLLAASGCGKNELPTDSFFEKWRRMAEESQGHSPAYDPERIKEQMATIEEEVEIIQTEETTQRPTLPDKRISLKMSKANLVAVIQAMARAVDQSVMVSPNVDGQVTVNIVDMPWDQVFQGVLRTNGLTWTWEGDIVRVLTLEDMENDLKLAELNQKRQSQRMETQKVEPPVMSLIKMKYAKASELQEDLTNLLTKDSEGEALGSVQVDESTNSLILNANRSDQNKIVKLLARLDRPRPQINMKAHIVETTSETARALGVQLGGLYDYRPADWDGTGATLIPGGTSGALDSDTGGWTYDSVFDNTGVGGQGFASNFPPDNFPSENTGGGLALGFLFGELGGNLLEAQLQALEEDNKLKILSSPTLTTLDNEMAYTENGARVPFVTINAEGERTVMFEDAVLRLEIEPQVIDNDQLRLRIVIKKDEVDLSRSVEGNPLIIKNNTETTLVARNGETVVISGLTKRTTTESDAGAPGLRDVPVLGWLFKSENKSDSLEEVLIFITPRVLPEWKPWEVQATMEEIEEEIAEEERKRAKQD